MDQSSGKQMDHILKDHFTIGCCGIDCGLCPRYHSDSASACPGCGGSGFRDKHPCCGFLTCCVVKHGLEVCAECAAFPCARFEAEKQGYDSFVTHRKVFANQDFIRKHGLDEFLIRQQQRIDILTFFLGNYDDGRSKSFLCLSCALLPPNVLEETKSFMEDLPESLTRKEKNNLLREKLLAHAGRQNIELKLRNRSK